MQDSAVKGSHVCCSNLMGRHLKRQCLQVLCHVVHLLEQLWHLWDLLGCLQEEITLKCYLRWPTVRFEDSLKRENGSFGIILERCWRWRSSDFSHWIIQKNRKKTKDFQQSSRPLRPPERWRAIKINSTRRTTTFAYINIHHIMLYQTLS